MKILQDILTLSSFKTFLKRFLFVSLVVVLLFIIWIAIVNYTFPTDYDTGELIEVSANCIYCDLVDFTPYIKRSKLSYLIMLDNGTCVYVPKYVRDEIFNEDNFETNGKSHSLTVEYDPNKCYSYRFESKQIIDVYKATSIRSSNQEYLSRYNYIKLNESIKREYIICYLSIVLLADFYLTACFFLDAFCDIKRIIIQDKKKKLKRAKREEYRKKFKNQTKNTRDDSKPTE